MSRALRRSGLIGGTIRSSLPFVATAIALAALSGCAASPGPESPAPASSAPALATPTAEATSPPAAAPETLTLDELHEAYIATGLPCDWIVTENVVSGSFESGVCRDSENRLNTFATQADLDGLLQLNEDSIEPGIFLVGDLWIVGSEHPEDLMTARTGMGGELWPADSPAFETD